MELASPAGPPVLGYGAIFRFDSNSNEKLLKDFD